jgi:hypothetical protein
MKASENVFRGGIERYPVLDVVASRLGRMPFELKIVDHATG